MPTAAYDPSLFREQETLLEIGKNCFLDQKIPAVVLSESKTRRRYGKSEWTKRESSRRKWTITIREWNFIKNQKRWKGYEQALITTIRKETKRTEELREAADRSPTWAVLRALQQINGDTIIEGEAAMSAPPFFQLAERHDLLFWEKKKDRR